MSVSHCKASIDVDLCSHAKCEASWQRFTFFIPYLKRLASNTVEDGQKSRLESVLEHGYDKLQDRNASAPASHQINPDAMYIQPLYCVQKRWLSELGPTARWTCGTTDRVDGHMPLIHTNVLIRQT